MIDYPRNRSAVKSTQLTNPTKHEQIKAIDRGGKVDNGLNMIR